MGLKALQNLSRAFRGVFKNSRRLQGLSRGLQSCCKWDSRRFSGFQGVSVEFKGNLQGPHEVFLDVSKRYVRIQLSSEGFRSFSRIEG